VKTDFLDSLNHVQRLVAVVASVFVKLGKVVLRVHLIPVGKQVGVSDGAVQAVRVENDGVRAWRRFDESA
jgi:hypothetical protein